MTNLIPNLPISILPLPDTLVIKDAGVNPNGMLAMTSMAAILPAAQEVTFSSILQAFLLGSNPAELESSSLALEEAGLKDEHHTDERTENEVQPQTGMAPQWAILGQFAGLIPVVPRAPDAEQGTDSLEEFAYDKTIPESEIPRPQNAVYRPVLDSANHDFAPEADQPNHAATPGTEAVEVVLHSEQAKNSQLLNEALSQLSCDEQSIERPIEESSALASPVEQLPSDERDSAEDSPQPAKPGSGHLSATNRSSAKTDSIPDIRFDFSSSGQSGSPHHEEKSSSQGHIPNRGLEMKEEVLARRNQQPNLEQQNFTEISSANASKDSTNLARNERGIDEAPAGKRSFETGETFLGKLREANLARLIEVIRSGWIQTRNGKPVNGLLRSELRLQLAPEELGPVKIELSLRHSDLICKLEAHTPEARLLLESGLAELKKGLSEHGLQVERLEVLVSTPVASSQPESPNSQQNHQQFLLHKDTSDRRPPREAWQSNPEGNKMASAFAKEEPSSPPLITRTLDKHIIELLV